MTAVEWLEKELKDRYSLMNSEPFFEQAKQMEKKQTVISDEEIEKAKEYHWSYRNGFVEGAKLYREQLKSK